jgi:hypothetical protein
MTWPNLGSVVAVAAVMWAPVSAPGTAQRRTNHSLDRRGTSCGNKQNKPDGAIVHAAVVQQPG